MWRKPLLAYAGAALQRHSWRWRSMATRAPPNASTAINSIILRSLKDHYLEASRMNPPPRHGVFTNCSGPYENLGVSRCNVYYEFSHDMSENCFCDIDIPSPTFICCQKPF